MAPNTRRILMGSCLAITLSGVMAAQQMPRTTTERVKTGSATKTEQLSGTVVATDSGTLVVRMPDGELRTFHPPESRRFIVDGKELTLRELRTGTKLTATVTTTETSVTERTTTVGSGKVWYVSGPNVILTLPNGENRQYKVQKDYKFSVGGKPATVFDLKKGMTVSAEKIVEVPKVELATNVTITGTAPSEVKPVAAAPPTPAPRPEPAPVAAARPPERAPEPAPAPAPEAPRKLPKTASPLPLIGLAGLLCCAASFCLRQVR